MTWTHFRDMHSGGGTKIDGYEHIYIEAPEDEAIEEFRQRFNRDPRHVSCECCGPDYSAMEWPSLKQATGHERNCRALKTPTDESGRYMNDYPGLRENFYLEPGEDPPEEFEVSDRFGPYGDHVPLEDFVERDDVLIIEADG